MAGLRNLARFTGRAAPLCAGIALLSALPAPLAAFAPPRLRLSPQPDLTREFLNVPQAIGHLAISPDGKQVAGATATRAEARTIPIQGVKLWDLKSRKLLQTLERVPLSANLAWSIAFSPNGKRLATGNADGVVALWDLTTGKWERNLTVDPKRVIERLAFSPDGRLLATGTRGNLVKLWNLQTGKLHSTLRGIETVDALAISPDGTKVAAGCGVNSQDEDGREREVGELHVWDLRTGRKLWSRTGKRPYYVHAVVFSPDGKFLASAGEQLKLWDTRTGKLKWVRKERPLHNREGLSDGHILSVAFSPQRPILASGTMKLAGPERNLMEELDLWDIASGRRLSGLTSAPDQGLARQVMFARDGRLFAIANSEREYWTVRAWRLP